MATTCADWEGNNSTLGFGSDLASEAAAINASESEQAPITAFASGGILPSLQFDVIDHFGNLVSGMSSCTPACAGIGSMMMSGGYSPVNGCIPYYCVCSDAGPANPGSQLHALRCQHACICMVYQCGITNHCLLCLCCMAHKAHCCALHSNDYGQSCRQSFL